jgi:hypothetical protein
VVGPGTLSFWWSISSEFTYDYLEFLTNGTRAALISGEVPWENQTYALGPGNQLLRWRYQKDSSDSNGQDTAWLDEVTFTAASVPFAVQAERSAENVRLSWPVHPQKNYSVVFKNDLTDATWQTLTQQIAISNGTATVTDSLLARPHRFYRVIEE